VGEAVARGLHAAAEDVHGIGAPDVGDGGQFSCADSIMAVSVVVIAV
jgi:hypothetical protein